jgi:acyl carrier protein
LNKKEIAKEVLNIFSIFLNISVEELSMESSPNNTTEWDSLNHIKIIMEIENIFNVEFSPEDSLEINTIKDVCNILNNKLN